MRLSSALVLRFSLAGFASLVVPALGGCSSDNRDFHSSGGAANGGSANGGASLGGGQNALGGNANAAGGSANGGNNSGSGGASSGGASQGGAPANGGSTNAAGGSNGSGGNTSGGNANGGAASGGASQGGATQAGSSAGGAASGGKANATGGSAGAGNASGGATSGGKCPAGATFCSDFEGTGLPSGAKYEPDYQKADWAMYMAIDTTQKHAGNSSLLVKATSGTGYSARLLSVPVPGSTFWVRAYMRSDADIGQTDHNAFMEAMVAKSGASDPGDVNLDSMEVAEQYCQVVLNHSDEVVTSNNSTFACGNTGTLLAKNTWHCVEAFFDGPNGGVQVYANGTKIIDKTGWTVLSYGAFNFGFEQFHGPARNMWYDDVVVAPARVGCQ